MYWKKILKKEGNNEDRKQALLSKILIYMCSTKLSRVIMTIDIWAIHYAISPPKINIFIKLENVQTFTTLLLAGFTV